MKGKAPFLLRSTWSHRFETCRVRCEPDRRDLRAVAGRKAGALFIKGEVCAKGVRLAGAAWRHGDGASGTWDRLRGWAFGELSLTGVASGTGPINGPTVSRP